MDIVVPECGGGSGSCEDETLEGVEEVEEVGESVDRPVGGLV